MAGSITAGVTLKIYSLLKDKENNKSKFSVISHINKVYLIYSEIYVLHRIRFQLLIWDFREDIL